MKRPAPRHPSELDDALQRAARAADALAQAARDCIASIDDVKASLHRLGETLEQEPDA